MTYTDDDLTAYLDGEMDGENVSLVQHDPQLQDRIAALSLNTDVIKTAFSPMLGVAQSRNLSHRLSCAIDHVAANASAAPHKLFQTASYAAVLAVGMALSWAMMPANTNDWRTEVAHYQALYVPDTLSPISLDTASLQRQFDRASNALGISLSPAMFENVKGLQLRRAQVLGFEGAPLVQVAFTMDDGTPVAFCIVQKTGADTTLTSDTLIGLASASWSNKTHGFLAIGGQNNAEIMAWATELKSRI